MSWGVHLSYGWAGIYDQALQNLHTEGLNPSTLVKYVDTFQNIDYAVHLPKLYYAADKEHA